MAIGHIALGEALKEGHASHWAITVWKAGEGAYSAVLCALALQAVLEGADALAIIEQVAIGALGTGV